ncbi:sensor histidine kinase [Pokkaliibacter sp. CJK22405]|uniref:sensor histidine kinase n=1 Tax=Pokkaliibacter sp. CJK22405 TaxID=3384615 RepID=UPI003984EEF9
MLRSVFLRSVLWPLILVTVLLLLALGLLLAKSWRTLETLEPVQDHLQVLIQLQAMDQHMQRLVLMDVQPLPWGLLKADVKRLQDMDGFIHPDSEGLLEQMGNALDRQPMTEQTRLVSLQNLFSTLSDDENAAHANLLKHVQQSAWQEAWLSALALGVFPSMGIALLFLMRRRIWQPLEQLGGLMNALTDEGYRPVSTEAIDPLLAPLYKHYNTMVERLGELEEEHISRHQTLEREIKRASRTLLLHQRELATAERMAAVGELGASLAHELRNPLAGISLTLANLQTELDDSDQAERLALAIAALDRMSSQLNSLLAQTRQQPEPVNPCPLRESIDEVIALVRYQIPDSLLIENRIPPRFYVQLAEGRLHQAVLNLVLNAAQSVGAHAGGKIDISAVQEEGKVLVQVQDNGPGFPQELLTKGVRTFASFREGGTGLGLAMVRRFMQDMGGDLRLANAEQGGAKVTLVFPVLSEEVMTDRS